MFELSQTQRRTGQRPALGLPVSTTAQPDNIAVSKSQVSGGSKLKTEVRNASNQAEVKPVVKPQPPRKVEKQAISKVSSLNRERPDISKSFSKPKRKLSNDGTGSSAGTYSVVATAYSVRLILAACRFKKLKASSKRVLPPLMMVRLSQ